ncbi:MAG TPA: cytochrome P450 [Vicinamibacteria bacterium]|nr:cytochrome P450 [Vicinamibacteria bacterium]
MNPIKASALADPRFKANPYPFYARMRAESPVFPVSVPFFGRGWLVTRYEDVVTVARDDRFSRDLLPKLRWLPQFVIVPMTRHMLGQDPPNHTRLRKLVSQAFTPGRIERLRARIQAVCDELLEAAPRTGSFDLVKGYAHPIPFTVIAELLGIPQEDRQRFHTLVQGSIPITAPTGILDVPMSLPYLWLILRYFRRLFAERRARPGDDLLSALVQAEEAGDRLDEDELLGMASLLLSAGYETTVHLIGNASLALLQHPDERARFVSEASLMDSAIEELLRYTSTVEMTLPRILREDVTLSSVTMPRGDWVSGVIGSANRDESVFAAPDTLDLGRDPNPHLALGKGRHFCLGASLLRLEAEIALGTLFRRFPGLRLAQPAESLRWRKLAPLRSLVELPVTGLD